MKLGMPQINERGTYILVEIETGEVIESFRLKGTALVRLSKMSRIVRKDFEVRRVK